MPVKRMLLLASIAPLPFLTLMQGPASGNATVLVRLAGGETADPGLVNAASHRVAGLGVIAVDVAGDPARAAARIAKKAGVAWAEPDVQLHALGRDPLRPAQWALDAINVERGWSLGGVGAPGSLSGVPIAVIDSGADTGHEDLRGRVMGCASASSGTVRDGTCRDSEGHGTHVAGIAAAATGNGRGISGVAADSPLLICRALGSQGSGSAANVAACVSWAKRKGAKVISMSLGGPPSRTLHEAIRTAWARGGPDGAVIVAAAGNDGRGNTSWPAAFSEVMSVGAVGRGGRIAPFSNSNPDVEISAPGVSVLSLRAGGGYVEMSGTSMAAPAVAGAAALLWQHSRTTSASAVRSALDRSVIDRGTTGRDPSFGFGTLDLSRGSHGR